MKPEVRRYLELVRKGKNRTADEEEEIRTLVNETLHLGDFPQHIQDEIEKGIARICDEYLEKRKTE